MDSPRYNDQEIISRTGAGAVLGEGAHGKVYAASWHDSPAALKIIGRSVADQELRATRKIQSIKSTISPFAAAILPDIYEADWLVGHGGYVLMEALEPLSPAASERLFAPLCNRSKKEQRACLNNEPFLHMIASSLYQMASSNLLADSVVRCVAQRLAARGIPETYDGECVQRIAEEVVRTTAGTHVDTARHLANLAVTRIAGAKSIPASSRHVHLCDEVGEDIRQALCDLLENGVSWNDLHEENLMSRGGQPVLIDFAEYELTDP
jgi:hypothetical protein